MGLLFTIGALAVLVFVVAKGGSEERLSICVMVIGFLLTGFFYRRGDGNWLETQWSILAVDVSALVIFLYIALRSKRFWPLPIAALQLLPVLTPLLALVGENMVSYGLGTAQAIWGYLQLVILIVATIRHQERKPLVPKK